MIRTYLKIQHIASIVGLLLIGAVLFRELTGVPALCAFLFTTLMAHTVIADKVYIPNLARLKLVEPYLYAWMAHIICFVAATIWALSIYTP